MSFSISQELRQSFHLNALRHEASVLLTGRQWEARSQLTDRCQKAVKQEKRLFNERFDGRMSQEYKKLMNVNAAKKPQHKPSFVQHDIFDRAGLLKQADANVRNRHEQRIAKLEQIETRGIETLLQRSSRENQLTGQSKDAFTRATERRSGKERRVREMGKKNQIHHQTR